MSSLTENQPSWLAPAAVGLGATGVTGGVMADKWLTDKIDKFNAWDQRTKELHHNEPFKSTTGRLLQVSPEQADKLLDTYVEGANDLAKTKIGPIRGGDLAYHLRTKLSGGPENQALAEHYKMFSNPNADKNALKTHMLDIFKSQKSELDPAYFEKFTKSYDSLPEDAKRIIEDSGTNIVQKYNNLLKSKDKRGLEHFEKFILGEGADHPGAVKLVGGGALPSKDSPLHRGFAKNYVNASVPALKVLRLLNRMKIGTGAAGVALGGYGLYNQLSKKASLSKDEMLGALETAGGGAVGSVGTFHAIDKLKQLIADLKADPNYNVGFTYGDLKGYGAGHKTPMANLRAVLERAVENLPDNHPLKNKIKFLDVGVHETGTSSNVAKDLNMLYNFGMGTVGRSDSKGGAGNPIYGTPNTQASRGEVMSLRNYLTDTPTAIEAEAISKRLGIPLPKFIKIPGLGAAVDRRSALGYTPHDIKTVAYGEIPAAHRFMHAVPGGFAGSLMNVAPDIVGTPFLNPTYLANLEKYRTRDAKLNRFAELVEADTSPNKALLSQILEDLRGGKRMVTIAGSGRGDYVLNRAAHMADSLNRAKMNNAIVVPLLGGGSGFNTVTPEDVKNMQSIINKSDPRFRAFGKLNNETYTLLQQLADVNMASTGASAAAEMANAGNIQAIPTEWRDGYNRADTVRAESGLLRDVVSKARGKNVPLKDIVGNISEENLLWQMPHLDSWNQGTIKQFPEKLPDVFKQIGHYDGPVREGAANYLRAFGASDDTIKNITQKFDTDEIVKMLQSDNFSDMSNRAAEAARNNTSKIKGAQEAVAKDMFKTLEKNVLKQRVKALPGLVGGLAGAGLGAFGIYDGVKRIEDARKLSNLKFS